MFIFNQNNIQQNVFSSLVTVNFKHGQQIHEFDKQLCTFHTFIKTLLLFLPLELMVLLSSSLSPLQSHIPLPFSCFVSYSPAILSLMASLSISQVSHRPTASANKVAPLFPVLGYWTNLSVVVTVVLGHT